MEVSFLSTDKLRDACSPGPNMPKCENSLSSTKGVQPISMKLFKGLGCCPARKSRILHRGYLDALLAKYDGSSKAKMHQGPLMPSLHSMNLPNSYFGKLRISPVLQNGRASTLSLVCPFLCAGFCETQAPHTCRIMSNRH